MMLRITSSLAFATVLGSLIACSAAPSNSSSSDAQSQDEDNMTPAPIELAEIEIEGSTDSGNPIENSMDLDEWNAAQLEADPEAGDEDEAPEAQPEELALVVAPEGRPAKSGDMLVWLAGHDDTVRIDAATGEIVGNEPGIRIAAGGNVWTAVKSTRPVALKTCAQLMAEGGDVAGLDSMGDEEHRPGSETRLAFVSGARSQTAVEFGVPKDTLAFSSDYQHEVTIAGSVGPYVFLHVDAYSYGCGAHGSTGSEFIVWDLEHERAVDLLNELPAEAELLALAKHEMREESLEPEDEPKLTELVPRLSADGQLVLGRQLTQFACYACSDGKWGSYSTSRRYFRTSLPPSLEAFATVPAGVVAFRKAHPEVRIRGFSAVP